MDNITQRVAVLTEKVKLLFGAQRAIRIMSAKNYPFKQQEYQDRSAFQLTEEDTFAKGYLSNKIWSRRLLNSKEDLGDRVQGAAKDLREINELVSAFKTYRDTVAEFATAKRNTNEGILGPTPDFVQSVSELMLFQSEVNVYGDSHVELADFEIKKPIPKRRKNQKQ